MKLILSSDLHQRIEKWGDLVSAVQTQKPRFVPIAGDLLPKVEAVSQQGEFFPEMARCFEAVKQVGPVTVLKFIKDNQPLLGCSGHIHESPYQPGGRWMAEVGKAVWVQPGQMGDRLHYACVELDGGLEVMGIRHSIFK